LPGVIGPSLLRPLYQSFDPDSVTELHAARLLILLAVCGDGSPRQIKGRTKLVKLDFFLRYPRFLERALSVLSARGFAVEPFRADAAEVEAPMIRYRYGPWDPRYGDFIAFLEARGLVRVVGSRVETFQLTALGAAAARRILGLNEFADLRHRAQAAALPLASQSGNALKDLIYEIFPLEVGSLQLREQIRG
jgi:hypothetical protein